MIVFFTHVRPLSDGGVAASCRRWLTSAEELATETAWVFTTETVAELYLKNRPVQFFEGSIADQTQALKTLLPEATAVFAHYYGIGAPLAFELSQLMSLPFIINFRGNDAVFESFSPSLSSAKIITKATHLIFVARHLKDLVESKFGHLSHKSSIVHNWLTRAELVKYSVAKDRNDREVIFGAAAIWKWKKGLPVILRMLQKHREMIKSFVIFGDTTQISEKEKRLLHELYDCGLPEILRYRHELITEMYKKIDVMVLPSLGEGSPNVLYEAAAHGRLIIGSEIPGIKEILLPFKLGITFRPGDSDDLYEKLVWILQNPNVTKAAMSENRRMCEKQSANPWQQLPIGLLKTIQMNA